MTNLALRHTVLLLFITSSRFSGIHGAAIEEPKAEAIIGGDPAIQGAWPSFVSIYRSNAFRCGGVLIHENLVLTAKHCVVDSTAGQLKVIVGDYQRTITDSSEKTVGVSSTYLHGYADLAVVELSCSPRVSNNVKVADLYTGPLPPEGTTMAVVGFGWTRSGDGTSLAETLQELMIPAADNFLCTQELGENGGAGVRTYEFCTGFPSASTYINVCHGDSGGPIYYKEGGRYKLAGITVRGPKYCPEKTRFAVFITLSDQDILNYVQGRIQNARSVSSCSPPVEYSPPEEKKKDCFPGDAIVMTDDGYRKSMKDVKRGDRVLAMTPEGALVYSDIIMVMHRNQDIMAEYYVINTSNGALRLSAKHMIYTQGMYDKIATYKFADKVQEGDFVFTGKDADAEVQKTRVTSIQKTSLQGVFAPVTLEGTIVVDYLIASCYAYIESHNTCHAVFYPARALHSWLPGSLGWGEPAGGEDFLHWYPHLVAAVTSPALSVAGVKM